MDAESAEEPPKDAGSGSKASKKPKKAAAKEVSSPTTNGHSSPEERSPPPKRSKRTEPEPEVEPPVKTNGNHKGLKKKSASKTPVTIPEDEELNTG